MNKISLNKFYKQNTQNMNKKKIDSSLSSKISELEYLQQSINILKLNQKDKIKKSYKELQNIIEIEFNKLDSLVDENFNKNNWILQNMIDNLVEINSFKLNNIINPKAQHNFSKCFTDSLDIIKISCFKINDFIIIQELIKRQQKNDLIMININSNIKKKPKNKCNTSIKKKSFKNCSMKTIKFNKQNVFSSKKKVNYNNYLSIKKNLFP